jgi:predicted DNA-binding protein with PD1-like motif
VPVSKGALVAQADERVRIHAHPAIVALAAVRVTGYHVPRRIVVQVAEVIELVPDALWREVDSIATQNGWKRGGLRSDKSGGGHISSARV